VRVQVTAPEGLCVTSEHTKVDSIWFNRRSVFCAR